MGFHQRLLLLPACTHCRCAILPTSLSLSRALNTVCLFSIQPLALARPRPAPPATPTISSKWWKEAAPLRGLCLGFFSHQFSSRARTRVATAQARLSEVSFTEESGLVLTDTGNQTLEGDNSKAVKKLPGSNIVISGPDLGRTAQVKEAEFIKSSSKETECPTEGFPEIALVGRSNVGKSSLINAMVQRKELAQTSKKPGKTQLINHFLINKKWYLVDLPGYGFAKAPTAIRTDWNEFTKDYFLNRKTLVTVLLLVDACIPPQQIDLDCVDWLGRNKIPVTIVFTKCDRKKKKKNGGRNPEENIQDFLEKLKAFFDDTPPWIMTSATTGQGRDELMRHLAQLRLFWDS
ncbi:hypothetical protein BDL97_08G093000 [Sphagnum fallax]|nr:hypothetical protein BDL97_08G093000 [Sphagnum fallax]